MRVPRRPAAVAVGIAVLAVAGVLVWRFSGPPKLGLDVPRVVLAAGEAHVDETRARPAQVVASGATVHTGRGSACFSVRASRACVGASGEVRLAELGQGYAVLEQKRGALVIAAVGGDELRVKSGTATVTVRDVVASIEPEGPYATVRALDGRAEVSMGGAAPVSVAAPDAVSTSDGRRRASVPGLEKEERSVVALARRWQGSAGSVIEVDQGHGRVEVDGADVGLAPAAILLDEGSHTLVVRDGVHEVSRETLELRPGQKFVRGG